MSGQALNPPAHDGLLLIISGPSGVGKTTITHHVEKRLQGVFSVSMTTREKTEADKEGYDYVFVDEEAFRAAVKRGEMLEWAEVFGHYYGTPRRPVELAMSQGRLVILEIDVAGAEQVKAAMPEALAIFVMPPSEAALLERLRRRNREGEAVIQRRFSKAKAEIERAQASGAYDHFIVNDTLEHAIEEAVSLVSDRLHAKT
jgi:guanylate kinase